MKFKMNNRNWEILETNQKDIKQMQNIRNANDNENIESVEQRYFGITYFDECKIYLDEALPKDKKRSTLIHELVHCFIDNYITHEGRNYTEENVCDVVANSYDIITSIIDEYFCK